MASNLLRLERLVKRVEERFEKEVDRDSFLLESMLFAPSQSGAIYGTSAECNLSQSNRRSFSHQTELQGKRLQC